MSGLMLYHTPQLNLEYAMFAKKSKSGDGNEVQQVNKHSAANAEQCEKMGELNGWTLLRVEPTRDPILKADCIFEGEQTSFMEDD